jgi:hypothetical protein
MAEGIELPASFVVKAKQRVLSVKRKTNRRKVVDLGIL